MRPKVSIVIPCYNDYKYIEQAVQSALGQTYSNKEIIVIDDGSDQRTKERLNKLTPKIDRLITQENQGVVMARNRAISTAKGEYILTLDSDDYFELDFLEKAVAIMNTDPKIGMVTCWMAIKDESDVLINIAKPTGASAFEALFNNSAPATLLYRKECWVKVEGYDNNLKNGYEDWEFNIAVTKHGWEIFVIPEVLYTARNKKESRNKKARKFYSEIRMYTYKKHKDIFIQNMDQTIDLFLDKLESQHEEIKRLKKSKPYLIGEVFLKPMRKARSLLFRFAIRNE